MVMGNSAALMAALYFFYYLPFMKISPFLFAEDPARKGAVLIVGTIPPFPVGQVWRFKSAAELDAWKMSRAAEQYIEVSGYYVTIFLLGTMVEAPNFLPPHSLNGMALFLAETRIERDLPYWKRYARK